ncbi:MAG TPA: hypothetical protein VGN18_02850 [Jatrophihabitans sp.]|uniref:hypothetical protein n=1 Tax=Jatrophihabitans sp. TaxID=1932789 RepID=UPI002DFCB536|nr:hypothetical protein [Jatrophihabitans sp.]
MPDIQSDRSLPTGEQDDGLDVPVDDPDPDAAAKADEDDDGSHSRLAEDDPNRAW